MRKIYFASGIVCAALFSACSDFDYDAHRGVYNSEKYEANFEKMIGGEVHPAQTWGFGAIGTRVAEPQGVDNPDNVGVTLPKAITEKERAWVMNWFATHPGGPSQTLDLKNYFVLHVGAGDKDNQGVRYQVSGKVWEKYENGEHVYRTDNATINSKEQMDWLASNLVANPTDPSVDCDHIERFNAANGNIMYMKESETQYGFTFHDSYGTVNKYVTDGYYMVYLYNEENEVDGWYVGFDYRFSKYEMRDITIGIQLDHEPWYTQETIKDFVVSEYLLEPDGYYNDWVVKIVPGNGEPVKPGDTPENPGDDNGDDDNDPDPTPGDDEIVYTWRIMAEDLGEDDDFDFNDVVFDAAIDIHAHKAYIKVLAAGGTIPLWIGDPNIDGREVHDAFHVATETMVNTQSNTATCDPATFVITIADHVSDPADIPIVVEHGKAERYVLEAPVGRAPQKICVPVGTPWSLERTKISHAFTRFNDYAQDPTKSDWYKDYLPTKVYQK